MSKVWAQPSSSEGVVSSMVCSRIYLPPPPPKMAANKTSRKNNVTLPLNPVKPLEEVNPSPTVAPNAMDARAHVC